MKPATFAPVQERPTDLHHGPAVVGAEPEPSEVGRVDRGTQRVPLECHDDLLIRDDRAGLPELLIVSHGEGSIRCDNAVSDGLCQPGHVPQDDDLAALVFVTEVHERRERKGHTDWREPFRWGQREVNQ